MERANARGVSGYTDAVQNVRTLEAEINLASISIAGGTSPTVAVYGGNLGATAGLGSDSVGSVQVGGTVSLGNLSQLNGNDTINLGSGSDTIVQSGQATVSGAFNTAMTDASVAGGEAQTTLGNVGTSLSGVTAGVQAQAATVIGGALDTATVTAQNTTASLAGVFSGVKADVTAILGSSGVDTLTGGAGNTVFEFLGADAGGQHTITNFVSTDQLYVEGYSLSYLQANNDISTQGGNTYINIDGGKTSIELKGITNLNSSEITTHKP
jgi:hypothetical protein